jgi:hypothetical protein
MEASGLHRRFLRTPSRHSDGSSRTVTFEVIRVSLADGRDSDTGGADRKS